MAPPLSYTEPTFAAFLVQELADTATLLGWTAVPTHASVQVALDATLRAFSTPAVPIATVGAVDLAKLEALGRREIWRRVVAATIGDYDTTEAQVDAKRSQAHAHAIAQYERAEAAARPYDGHWAVQIVHRLYPGDPYAYLPENRRLG